MSAESAPTHTFAERARLGERLKGEFVFDAHGHIGDHAPFYIPRTDAASLVEVMDRIGVAGAAVSHLQGCLSADTVFGNDELMAAQERCPGRLVGYVGLFPHAAEGMVPEIERCAKRGLRAVKIHEGQGKPYEAPEYEAAWELINARGYPTLLHTWGKTDQYERLAERYPNTPLLLGHSGANNVDGYCRAAAKHDNLFLELACSISTNGLVEEFVRRVGAHKVLWGSDMLFLNGAQQIGRVLFARISDDDKRAILGLNARRIFGLTN